METEVSVLDIFFNKLYEQYNWTHVVSYPDMLVFNKIPFGYSKSMERELNVLIQINKLPLIAKANLSHECNLFYDTIQVVPTEDYKP